MEADLQLSVIREFMLAVAPTVVRHSLRSAVFDEVGALPTYTAAQTAKLTLELAMHLAGQYAACYDSLHRETKSARIQIKQKSKTDAAVQPAKD